MWSDIRLKQEEQLAENAMRSTNSLGRKFYE